MYNLHTISVKFTRRILKGVSKDFEVEGLCYLSDGDMVCPDPSGDAY